MEEEKEKVKERTILKKEIEQIEQIQQIQQIE